MSLWREVFSVLFLFTLFRLSISDHLSGDDKIVVPHTYFERLEKSKSDVIVGGILILFLPFFIWFVERQVASYEKLIARCQLSTRVIQNCHEIKPWNNNHPILVKGLTSVDETLGILRDTELGYQFVDHLNGRNIVRLKRIVEIFQWTEHIREEDEQTTYTYEKSWSEYDCLSEEFRDPSYYNPPRQPQITSLTKNAEGVYVGAYLLNSQQINQLHDWKPCPIPTIPSLAYSSYHHLYPRIEKSSTFSSGDGSSIDYLLFNGGSLFSPEIGTVRVSYQCVYASSPITTVGVQIQNTFRPYYPSDSTRNSFSLFSCCSTPMASSNTYTSIDGDDDDDYSSASCCCCCCCFVLFQTIASHLSRGIIGSEILLVEERLTDLKTIFRDEKRSLFWRLFFVRIISYFLFSIGIYLLLKPIATLLSFIPLVGSLISTTLWIASLLMGFLGGILISSLAWTVYRPSILAAVLLSIGGALWITAPHDNSEQTLLIAKIICGLGLIPACLSVLASFEEWNYRRYLSQLEAESVKREREEGGIVSERSQLLATK